MIPVMRNLYLPLSFIFFLLLLAPPGVHAEELSWACETKWSGTYFYPERDTRGKLVQPRQPVQFDLIIFCKDGTMSGSVKEPSTFIEGIDFLISKLTNIKFDGTVLKFDKTYEGVGGKKHTLNYEGLVSRSRDKVAGFWILPGWSGTFYMERQ